MLFLKIETKDDKGVCRVHFINLALKQCLNDIEWFVRSLKQYPTQYVTACRIDETRPLR